MLLFVKVAHSPIAKDPGFLHHGPCRKLDLTSENRSLVLNANVTRTGYSDSFSITTSVARDSHLHHLVSSWSLLITPRPMHARSIAVRILTAQRIPPDEKLDGQNPHLPESGDLSVTNPTLGVLVRVAGEV